MDSKRLQRVNQLLQEELADIFRIEANKIKQGLLISVTEVRTAQDLSTAKIFISVFPTQYRNSMMNAIHENVPYYRKKLGERIGKQMRIVPELHFFTDDSLDRVDAIERELKGQGNNPEL